MLHALSTIVSLAPTDVLSFTAVAAIAMLAVLAAIAVRRTAIIGATTYGPAAAAPGRSGELHAVARLFDPDAAGRPRPRAPSADPAA